MCDGPSPEDVELHTVLCDADIPALLDVVHCDLGTLMQMNTLLICTPTVTNSASQNFLVSFSSFIRRTLAIIGQYAQGHKGHYCGN